jgi:reactive intermediate/imine deaminase
MANPRQGRIGHRRFVCLDLYQQLIDAAWPRHVYSKAPTNERKMVWRRGVASLRTQCPMRCSSHRALTLHHHWSREMQRQVIHTDLAPAAIGNYSQAIRTGSTVYLSGQIPIDPKTQKISAASAEDEIHQVFSNLRAVAEAAGGDLAHVVKLTVYLTDLADSPKVNSIMAEYFSRPYPARVAVGIASLPQGCRVEADAIMVLE